MPSFVSKVPPYVELRGIKRELSPEVQELFVHNRDMISKVAETVAMKVLPLSTLLDHTTTLAKETEEVRELIAEIFEDSLKDLTHLGARAASGNYEIEASVGEFQDEDNDFNPIGPRELRMALDISIPLDTVFLRLPPKMEKKIKRVWAKLSAEDKGSP